MLSVFFLVSHCILVFRRAEGACCGCLVGRKLVRRFRWRPSQHCQVRAVVMSAAEAVVASGSRSIAVGVATASGGTGAPKVGAPYKRGTGPCPGATCLHRSRIGRSQGPTPIFKPRRPCASSACRRARLKARSMASTASAKSWARLPRVISGVSAERWRRCGPGSRRPRRRTCWSSARILVRGGSRSLLHISPRWPVGANVAADLRQPINWPPWRWCWRSSGGHHHVSDNRRSGRQGGTGRWPHFRSFPPYATGV